MTTTTTPTTWVRVTRAAPCPICARPDWCGISADGAVVRCMRVESPRPCRADAGGWLHRLTDAPRARGPIARPLPVRVPVRDFAALARRYFDDLSDRQLQALSDQLGLEAGPLRAIGVGWTGRAYSFPMRDGAGVVVGIRLRHPRTGQKWSEKGGREGCFLPWPRQQHGRLMLPEGASDAAVCVQFGLDVAGRPSCGGGTRIVAELAKGRDVVILIDRDDAGVRGGKSLAAAILPLVTGLRIVAPPPDAKDLREALQHGLTRERLLSMVEEQPVRRLSLREVRR